MKVLFYFNERPREYQIGRHLQKGAARHNIDFEMRPKREYRTKYEGPDFYADLTLAYGVKSYEILAEHARSGVNWGIIDKGYIRRYGPKRVELYTRMSINQTYPKLDPRKDTPDDKWLDINVQLTPHEKSKDGHILVAGSSQKFYGYFGCGGEVRFHRRIIKKLRQITDRQIVFRGKPSFEKMHGTGNDYGADVVSKPQESIHKALEGAHCLVTFASNAACDAIFSGVPAVVFGPHISTPVTNSRLLDVVKPFFPEERARKAWAHQLAYEQWTLEEMASGETWEHLIPVIQAGPLNDDWWLFDKDMNPNWGIVSDETQ